MEHRLTKKEWDSLGDVMVEVSEILEEMAVRIVTIETRLELLEGEVDAVRKYQVRNRGSRG